MRRVDRFRAHAEVAEELQRVMLEEMEERGPVSAAVSFTLNKGLVQSLWGDAMQERILDRADESDAIETLVSVFSGIIGAGAKTVAER